MSRGDARGQGEQQIDHALVLAGGNEIKRLVVFEFRIGRSEPEPCGVISDNSTKQVDDRLELEKALFRFPARLRFGGVPAVDAPGVCAADSGYVGGINDLRVVEVVEQG